MSRGWRRDRETVRARIIDRHVGLRSAGVLEAYAARLAPGRTRGDCQSSNT
jgi:hypothetical protein